MRLVPCLARAQYGLCPYVVQAMPVHWLAFGGSGRQSGRRHIPMLVRAPPEHSNALHRSPLVY